MCGISGFIAPSGMACKVLKDATDIISYRGPDDEGFAFFGTAERDEPAIFSGKDTPSVTADAPAWFPRLSIEQADSEYRVGLGHRRLAILDLSSLGHQPMSYLNGRYWIVYNGEIYNYLELRNELTKLGHVFVSDSDTEVILAAYAEWGPDCLPHFNGMWSFAIYDSERRTLFLARDRFGVKPLYYWLTPQGALLFGSEIKQFTVVPHWKATLNHQRAYDYLVWGITDHTDETLFEGVYQVLPGHYALLDTNALSLKNNNGRIDIVRWYNLPTGQYDGTFEEAGKMFAERLRESVKLRLRSDVPVGSCLSGGLDSSSIVCLMSNILKEQGATAQQKTFSALSSEEIFNEEKWIKPVVNATGADAHYTTPDMGNLFDLADTIVWHQDEPYGSTSIFAQWKVFELSAREKVRVMLDGQGADEQLFGYHGAVGIRLAGLFKKGRWVQLLTELNAHHTLHGYSWGKLGAQILSVLLPDSMQKHLRKLARRSVPDPDWINTENLSVRKTSFLGSSQKSVQDYCKAQLTSTNLQMLLHWEDRDSMAHSIESRVPFLDYRLVEFSMSLPDDYKIRDGITKRVLRKGMSGIIPDVIRDRMDKIGFATPEEIWMLSTAPDLFRQKLRQSIAASKGVLNEKCLEIFEQMVDGKRPFGFVVWRMICFGQWMKRFNVEGARA